MVKDSISFPDFSKLDIRVGLVQKAEDVQRSEKLIRLTVNLGKDYGIRTVLTGIRQWCKAKQMVGKKFLFLANLAPKKIMGEESCGMILSSVVEEDGQVKDVQLIKVNKKITEGTEIR